MFEQGEMVVYIMKNKKEVKTGAHRFEIRFAKFPIQTDPKKGVQNVPGEADFSHHRDPGAG